MAHRIVGSPAVVPLGPPRFLWARKVGWVWSRSLRTWVVWRRAWSRQLDRAPAGIVGLLVDGSTPSGRIVVIQGSHGRGGTVQDWTRAVWVRATRAATLRSPCY